MQRSSGKALGHVAVSFGIAVRRMDHRPSSLVERANDCLYAAKRARGDHIVGATDGQANPVVGVAGAMSNAWPAEIGGKGRKYPRDSECQQLWGSSLAIWTV